MYKLWHPKKFLLKINLSEVSPCHTTLTNVSLQRYCKKVQLINNEDGADKNRNSNLTFGNFNLTFGYSKPRHFFSNNEEQQLVAYLVDAFQMFFGLSPKETRKLAFQFATNIEKELPHSWQINSSTGADWSHEDCTDGTLAFVCPYCE